MNRTELIEAISSDTGLSRSQSEAALDAVVYEITSGVRSGAPVRITGFGTFKIRERKARSGRNPQTGAAVKIKASKGIGFTPGVKLKADLNSRGALPKPKPTGAPAAKAAAPSTTARKTVAAKATVAKKAAPVAKKAAPVAKKAAPVAKKVVAAAKKAAPAAKKAAPAKKAAATKAPAKKATARR